MIILIRSKAITDDPRVQKYLHYYQENNIDFKVIGWDRLGQHLNSNDIIYFRRKSGYFIGGYKATLDRLCWIFFVIGQLFLLRRQVKVIHGCDLDGAFPAACFQLITRRKFKLIFDVFDWFSATLYAQNKYILFVIHKMEEFTIRHANEVIICEPERVEQIPYRLNHKEIVNPNIPSFNDYSFLHYDDQFLFNDEKIIVSYVGGLDVNRMLTELLNIAESGIINLLIAGHGNTEFESRCKLLSSLQNVKYFGKVEYKNGLNIMYNSDIVYAIYSKSNPNHLYAAPNKYYETMLVGKPIMSNKGLNLTSKIMNNGIGYVIDETESDLIRQIQNLDRTDMIHKGKLAQELWEKKYKTYNKQILNSEYLKLIK